MTIAIEIINAHDTGAAIVHDLGDDMAVVEYANGRFTIADVSDLTDFGEIMPITGATKFASADRDANIAAMVAKYHA